MLLGAVGTPFILLQAGLDQAMNYWSWGGHDITNESYRRGQNMVEHFRTIQNTMEQHSVSQNQFIKTLPDNKVKQSHIPPSCALSLS